MPRLPHQPRASQVPASRKSGPRRPDHLWSGPLVPPAPSPGPSSSPSRTARTPQGAQLPEGWGPDRRPAIPWKVESRVLPQVPSLPGASEDHLLPTVRAAPACAVSAQRSWETGVQAPAEDRAPPPGGSSGDGRDIPRVGGNNESPLLSSWSTPGTFQRLLYTLSGTSRKCDSDLFSR